MRLTPPLALLSALLLLLLPPLAPCSTSNPYLDTADPPIAPNLLPKIGTFFQATVPDIGWLQIFGLPKTDALLVLCLRVHITRPPLYSFAVIYNVGPNGLERTIASDRPFWKQGQKSQCVKLDRQEPLFLALVEENKDRERKGINVKVVGIETQGGPGFSRKADSFQKIQSGG